MKRSPVVCMFVIARQSNFFHYFATETYDQYALILL